jgi:hypothetical protein
MNKSSLLKVATILVAAVIGGSVSHVFVLPIKGAEPVYPETLPSPSPNESNSSSKCAIIWTDETLAMNLEPKISSLIESGFSIKTSYTNKQGTFIVLTKP